MVSSLAAAVLCLGSLLARAEEPSERVANAAKVFQELVADKNGGLPIDTLNHAACVVILPLSRKPGSSLEANMAAGL
jgi:hypothetical protein